MLRRFAVIRMGVSAGFLALVFGLSGASAQDMTLLENTDLPGFDYSILKDTDLDACTQACSDDRICEAFTFNSQSNWCFLKSGADTEVQFDGATSGRIDHNTLATEATRQAELPFPAQDLIDAARRFAAELPQTDAPPPKAAYLDLVASGDEAVGAENSAGAIIAFRQALALNGNDPVVWQSLAQASLKRAEAVAGQPEGDNSYDLASTAISAALNAFLKSTDRVDRADALAALANGLEYRAMWREAIATYRLSPEPGPQRGRREPSRSGDRRKRLPRGQP